MRNVRSVVVVLCVSLFLAVFLTACDRGEFQPTIPIVENGQNLANTAGGGNLYAIIVGDTEASGGIGPGVVADFQNINVWVDKIAANTGLTPYKTTFVGTAVRIEAVKNAIEAITATTSDVIVFYYSGHGGREYGKKTRWPNMYFHYEEGEPLDLMDVFSLLQRKRPGVLIAISDSCNNLPDGPVPGASFLQFAGEGANQEGYSKLFLQENVAIIASGSAPGEYSIGLENGGAFTLQFLADFEQEVAQGQNASWQALMARATRPIENNVEGQSVQHPQSQIY